MEKNVNPGCKISCKNGREKTTLFTQGGFAVCQRSQFSGYAASFPRGEGGPRRGSEEERRNLIVWNMPKKMRNLKYFCPHSSSVICIRTGCR